MINLAAQNPAHLYFTGRNSKAGSEVLAEVKCSVTFIKCNLSAPRDVIRRTLVENFLSSRLDIFIANAGIMTTPPGLTQEGFEVQFGTNYLGHAFMLKALRPVMLRTASESGGDVRLLMISSVGHRMHPEGGIQFEHLKEAETVNKWARYGQSKLADILYSKAMAKRYPQITSVSVHPGAVKTNLIYGMKSRTSIIISAMLSWYYFSAEKGSYNTLWAATTAKQNLENGCYYEPVGKKGLRPIAWWGEDEMVSDKALTDKLWEWTENEIEDVKEISV